MRTSLATIAVNMVAATLTCSRHPEVSAATATAVVIGVAISCTDQVARLSSMMRQCSLLQRDLPQFNSTESQSRHWIERASCAARNNQDPDDEALDGRGSPRLTGYV